MPDRRAVYERNMRYAVPASSYLTALSPAEEGPFQAWVKANRIPFDPSPQADYDMRGFYKAQMAGDPHAETGMNRNDHKMHFTDYFKTPYHESFSAESKWATPQAPRWNDQDQLVLPNGSVVFDEKQAVRDRIAQQLQPQRVSVSRMEMPQ